MGERRGGASSGRRLLSGRALAAGVLMGAGVTLLAGIVVSLVLALSEWEGPSTFLLRAINYGSAIIGGVVGGRIAGRVGWMHGALVGLLYVIAMTLPAGRRGILVLASSEFMLRALALCVSAMLGGMFGVGTTKHIS
ncbi:MAG: TIGR04086 family membrane protein [Firmicutes bacterium]|jgi:putative membrane protein (TIGR04086 family)|nr:TIGR04086 family membrane protein [Bacillota bacterium]